MKLLAMLLLLLPVLQENQTESLIKQLDSDKVEERENASQKLRAIGPSALGHLLQLTKSSDLELAHRANNIIHQIKHDVHVKEVTRALPPVTLKYDKAKLSDIIKSVKEQTGVELTASIHGDTIITVDMVNTPILKALDLICAGAVERAANWELGWYQRNNEISFGITDEVVNKPTVYLDKYRLQVTGTASYVRNDFRGTLTGVSFWINVAYEPQFKPFIGPSLTVTSMTDENGKAVLMASDSNITGKDALLAAQMWRNCSDGKGEYFGALNVPIGSKKLGSIKGKVSSVVELERTTMTFDILKKGSVIEFNDMKIWIDETFDNNNCGTLRVQFSGHRYRVEQIMDAQVTFTDKEGVEHKLTVQTSHDQFYFYPQGEGGPGFSWTPVSMSFDIITDWLECEREFEFTDIPLR